MQDLRPVAGAPSLATTNAELLRQIEVLDERGEQRSLLVPVERPLTVMLDGQECVTLMTLGAMPAFLVLGYLRNQRIIEAATDIESINVDWRTGRALVTRRVQSSLANRPGLACSLGTEFGEIMRQVEAVPPKRATARISRLQLLRILEVTREHDAIHRSAGSVHGCALFQGGELLLSLEDVSRHNGLDTVVGWMMLYGINGEDKVLFTTGRLTGEMVLKAAHNGISIMASRNGVTSMGYEIAKRLGMVLFGRAAKGRYLCYAGSDRFDSSG